MRRTIMAATVVALLSLGLAAGASVSDYTWTVSGLAVNGDEITETGGTGYGIADGTFGTDYTVTAVCTMHEDRAGGYWCGVHARQQNAPAFATTQAYMAMVGGSHGEKVFEIHRLGGGTSAVELISVPFPYQVNVPYVLALTVQSDQITGCVDDLCRTVTDSVLTEGTAGVGIRAAISSMASPVISDFAVDGDVSPPDTTTTTVGDTTTTTMSTTTTSHPVHWRCNYEPWKSHPRCNP